MNQRLSFKFNPWREISILMTVLMEVSWVAPWFKSLIAGTSIITPLRAFIFLTAIVLFAHILIRVMSFIRIKTPLRQAIYIVFLVISIFIGIKTMLYLHQSMSLIGLLNTPFHNFADFKSLLPPEFVVSLAVIIAFWRGLSIAQEPIGPSAVTAHFWIGVTMYIIFVLVNTLLTGETPGDFFYLFLFASLLAMCASRMTIISMLRGGLETKFNRFWLIGIILAAMGIVGLAAALGNMVGEQFIRFVRIVFGFLTIVLGLIWILLNPIFTYIITALANILQNPSININIGEGFQQFTQMMQKFNQQISNMLGQAGVNVFFERWGSTIKAILLVGLLVVVISVLILWMVINLWQEKRRQSGEEEKSNLQIDNLLDLMKDLLRRRWGGAKDSLTQLIDFRRRQRLRAAARIRQVYAELMDLCETLGHSRKEAETPLEFLPELKELFPKLQSETALITQSYNSIRYGQLPETQQEVREVENSWKKIYETGHKLSIALNKTRKK